MAFEPLRPDQKAEDRIFDRVLNPTLGVLQQPIWRIWRAIKEEDVDLFSREGLLDPALLPLAGVFFNQKSRVDPDELFGENIGAQIGGSIATDPLSFFTSGLTSAAKVGKGLGSLQGTVALKQLAKKAGVQATDEAGKDVGQKALLQGLLHQHGTVDNLNGAVKELLDEGLQVGEDALTSTDYKALRKLTGSMEGADGALDLGAAYLGRGTREMGLGLPIMGDLFGAYVPLSTNLQKKWGSWTKVYTKGIVGGTYKGLGKVGLAPIHMLGKSGIHLPFLGPMAHNTQLAAEDFMKGLRSGNQGAVALDRLREISKNLNPEQFDKLLGSNGTYVYNKLLGAAKGELARDVGPQQVDEALKGANSEELARLMSQAYGRTEAKFQDIEESIFGMVGRSADEGALTEADFFKLVENRDAAQFDAHGAGVAEFKAKEVGSESFFGELGRKMSKMHTLMFRNDIGIEGFEEVTRLKNHITSATAKLLDSSAQDYYAKLGDVSRKTGLDEDALDKFMLGLLELNPEPYELKRTMDGLLGSFEGDTVAKQEEAYTELNNYWGSRVMSSLNYLLATSAENIDDKQLGMFDELFKLLEVDPTKEGGIFLETLGAKNKLNKAFAFDLKEGTTYSPSSAPTRTLNPSATFAMLDDLLGDAGRLRSAEASKLSAEQLPNNVPLGSLNESQLTSMALQTLDKLVPNGKLAKLTGVRGGEVRAALQGKLQPEQTRAILSQARDAFNSDVRALDFVGEGIKGSDEGLAAEQMVSHLFTRVVSQLDSPQAFEAGDTVADLYSKAERSFMVRHGRKVEVGDLDQLPTNALADAEELSELKSAFLNAQGSKATLDMWRATNLGDTLQDMPPALIERMMEDMSVVAKLVTKAGLRSLGKDGEELFDALALGRVNAFTMADSMGMLPDVLPIGFAHRIKDSATERAINNALGGFADSADGGLFTPYVNSLFKRSNREYTVRELNVMRDELAKQVTTEQGKNVVALIDKALKAEGHGVPAELYRESAVDAMIGHMANVTEFKDHVTYYDSVFSSKIARENGVVAGRVVGVFDDATRNRTTKTPGGLVSDIQLDDAGQPVLQQGVDAGMRNHNNIGYVLETADGKRTIVHHARISSGGFSGNVLGEGEDIQDAMLDFLRNKNVTSVPDEVSLSEAKLLQGKVVSFAPRNVNNAIYKEMSKNTPDSLAGILKVYDSVHTTLKLFATGLRFPLQFGVSNTISAVPQGMLTGIGPSNTIQGMWLAARMLGGPLDDLVKHDDVTSLLALGNGRAGGMPVPKWIDAAVGDRAGGEFLRQIDRIAGGNVPDEDLILKLGDRNFTLREVVEAMADSGALEVRTSGELKNIRSTPEMLREVRKLFTQPGPGAAALKGKRSALAFASSTEQFVRLSGMLGALAGGMDLDTAARAVSDAMVDYSDLTKLEQSLAKRSVFFYTFPRKMIPLVMKKALENPSKAAAFLHSTLGNEDLFVTSEGRVELKLDDYRVNMSRLAPQFDAPVMLAAMADILPIDIRRHTGEGRPDLAFTPSGVTSLMGWHEFFPTSDPLATRGGDWYDDAIRSNWVSKLIMTDHPLLGTNDPLVRYSPLELGAKTFLPFRKVRPDNERNRKRRRLQMTIRDVRSDAKAANLRGDQEALEAAQRALEQLNQSLRRVNQSSSGHQDVFF